MHTVNEEKPSWPMATVSINDIDWEQAKLLSAIGAYGLIYRVAPGLVVKVGFIEPEEAELQQRLAGLGKTLPVLAYVEACDVPQIISQTFCAQHGRRSLPKDMIICCCGSPLDVLLMPEADTAIWDHYDDLTIAEFLEEIDTFCFEQGVVWDVSERNLAMYSGRLVALDWGNPEAPCW